MYLPAEVGVLLQFSGPVIGAKDCFFFVCLQLTTESCIGCVFNKIRKIFWIQCIQNIEEIFFAHLLCIIHPFVFKI